MGNHIPPTAGTFLPTPAQGVTINTLEDLAAPARDIVVEAWVMTECVLDADDRIPAGQRGPGPGIRRQPVVATELCSNDTDHGMGTCYGPTGDALCPACMVTLIRQDMVNGSTYSIEVAA